jgi:hypothetical protein
MYNSQWQPPPDWDGVDTGVYGDTVHETMSQKYHATRGRLPDVWLDQHGNVLGYDKGYHWRPTVPNGGTTQIDLLAVKAGYTPEIGKPLDQSKLIAAVDFKSSGRAKWSVFNDDFALRVRNLTGLEVWAPITEYRYSFARRTMEASKTVQRTVRLFRGVSRALPFLVLVGLPGMAEAMDKAVSDTQIYLIDYSAGVQSANGSQTQMAISIREVLSYTSLSPGQEVGNHIAAITLSVLDVSELFEYDPEYD